MIMHACSTTDIWANYMYFSLQQTCCKGTIKVKKIKFKMRWLIKLTYKRYFPQMKMCFHWVYLYLSYFDKICSNINDWQYVRESTSYKSFPEIIESQLQLLYFGRGCRYWTTLIMEAFLRIPAVLDVSKSFVGSIIMRMQWCQGILLQSKYRVEHTVLLGVSAILRQTTFNSISGIFFKENILCVYA
jgi:hypothetical protein